MNKIDRLYKKALQEAKNDRIKELIAQSIKFMAIWVDIMNYCQNNDIIIPEQKEKLIALYKDVCMKCGYAECTDDFIEWYFDDNNDTVFIVRDYGDGDIEYGY